MLNIIAVILDADLQVMVINQINIKILCEFLKLLIDHTTTTGKYIMKKIIITSIGAKYHISKDTNKFLVENEVVIQTISYCPESSWSTLLKTKLKIKYKAESESQKQFLCLIFHNWSYGTKLILGSVKEIKQTDYQEFFNYYERIFQKIRRTIQINLKLSW